MRKRERNHSRRQIRLYDELQLIVSETVSHRSGSGELGMPKAGKSMGETSIPTDNNLIAGC